MNAPIQPEIIPIIGTAMGGGFYAGRIRIDGQMYALIVAPKAGGEHEDAEWIDDYKTVPGAMSFCDGLANTNAMAEAGSDLAKWARDLRIDGHDDWYLPSLDELEVIYRNLKPTTRQNYCWARSGINQNSAEPSLPYTPDSPAQTQAEAFQDGAKQAFEPVWYWTSTQHAGGSEYAWCQLFDDGGQHNDDTDGQLRARAVRRQSMEETEKSEQRRRSVMDIVERLRNGIDFDYSREAADEIERLRAEVAQLRAENEAYKNQDPAGWCIQQ